MPAIDPSLYLRNQTSTRGVPDNNLGKDDFMKILMTQLQNQDPSNPMDDREFISQLAQFSSLEQTMNMSKAINELVQSQQLNPIIQYSHLIGKTVSYQGYNEETGEKLTVQTSEVVAVSQIEGHAVLELRNGEKVFADLILEVKSTGEDSKDDDLIVEETNQEVDNSGSE
ncbi:flagellar hook assembly protein FlgD [Ornithinibacillus californiensis]|uniref:flagellar hook assembly protein FlgD n=1 Tax=Ornithinibacillus californiensis TaxID=161536 RepID=UPI00064DE6A1|nr:flagellar hook assembly protein FlgD [Ornithinibacillus californiensis]